MGRLSFAYLQGGELSLELLVLRHRRAFLLLRLEKESEAEAEAEVVEEEDHKVILRGHERGTRQLGFTV